MTWWKKSPKTQSPENFVPLTPQVYPSGIAVRTSKGAYYLHKDGKRYRIRSQAVFDSWRFPLVIITTELALENYPLALTQLGFRDGTLLNNIADGRMYVVSDSKLRHVTSPAVLTRLGVTKEDFVTVSDQDINIMKMGVEIV